MRIASLLPSATEIVWALGLDAQLVAVTHECDHPPTAQLLPKLTRTHLPEGATSREIDGLVRNQLAATHSLYGLDADALHRAAPDLILAQTLCAVCAVSEADVCAATAQLPTPPRVLYLEPTRFEDVLNDIQTVAHAAGVADRGRALVSDLYDRVHAVRARVRIDRPPPRVCVLEWLDPPFSCGHWTPELVALAGGIEPLAQPGERSRRLSPSEIAAADPDVLFVACCGQSVARALEDLPAFLAAPEIAGLRAVQNARVYVSDGSAYFSRPGPRLVDSLELLAHAIDCGAHPIPPGIAPAVRWGGQQPRPGSSFRRTDLAAEA